MILAISVTNCRTEKNCDEYYDCESCTSSASWVGKCRWCPLDRACHALGSLTNECTPSQNIKDASDCRHEIYGEYNPYMAYEQVLLSAVAYTNEPRSCLAKLLPKSGFKIKEIIGSRCGTYLFHFEDCFAYIAVAHHRRKIVIAFRGTLEIKQLLDEILTVIAIPKIHFKIGGQVQAYFANAYENFYPCISESIKELVKKYPEYDVQITGHSLGAATASLISASLVYDNYVDKNKLSLYTFGMPRVGDKDYAAAHDKLINNSWRVVHYKDPVSQLPTCNLPSNLCALKNTPYHHRTEILYPDPNMTMFSHYIRCQGNEDDECQLSCKISELSDCIDYHTDYFNIPVGDICDSLANGNKLKYKKSEFGDKFTETCRRIRFPRLISTGTNRARTGSNGSISFMVAICFTSVLLRQ